MPLPHNGEARELDTGVTIALIGLGVGFLVGMTGIGGSALMAPLLILVFGAPPSIAIGTDLAYSIPMKWAGAWQHHRQGHVRWHAVWLLTRGSVPATFVSALLVTQWVHMDDSKEMLLRRGVGVALLLAAGLILWQLSRVAREQRALIQDLWFHHPMVVTLWGVMVGFLVGFTSIGSGSLLAPLLLLLPLSAQEVVGTGMTTAAILVTVGGITYIAGGTVDVMLTLNLLIGAVPGVLVGSRLSRLVSERRLRAALALILLGVALHLLGLY